MVQQTLSYRRLYRHSEVCWTGAGCGSLWRKGDACSWRQSCGGESDRKVEWPEQRCQCEVKGRCLAGNYGLARRTRGVVWRSHNTEVFDDLGQRSRGAAGEVRVAGVDNGDAGR